MYDLEKFISEKVYIKLETQEKYNKVMEWLENLGFQWTSEELPTFKNWWFDDKETISITHGYKGGVEMQYCSEQFYKNKGYTELLPNDKGEEKMRLSEFYEKYGDQNISEKDLKEMLGIKDQKHFKPKDSEDYFWVSSFGYVIKDTWGGYPSDNSLYTHTILYRTEEEAELARDENQFLLKMQRDFKDNSDVIDWEDFDQDKYYLFYDYRKGEVVWSYLNSHKGFDMITTNKEWLQKYIKDNEESIIKYYFGIKEHSNE